MLFETGETVQTRAIADTAEEKPDFRNQILAAFDRYIEGDWGNVSEDDAKMNDDALEDGGRLMGSYDTDEGEIWIITEADRSATTILFPSDY